LDYSPYGVKRRDLPSVPRFVHVKLEPLSLSINVNKDKIPNLDFFLIGVKRNWVPLRTRFGDLKLMCSLKQTLQLVYNLKRKSVENYKPS